MNVTSQEERRVRVSEEVTNLKSRKVRESEQRKKGSSLQGHSTHKSLW